MRLFAVILLHFGIRFVHDSVDRPCIVLRGAELKTDEEFSVRSAFAKRHISFVALIYPASAFKRLAANRAKRRGNKLI